MNISNELNFSDTNASTNATDEMSMALGPRIFWDILFGSMIFVAVVGNLIVLWIVAGKQKIKHSKTQKKYLELAPYLLSFLNKEKKLFSYCFSTRCRLI